MSQLSEARAALAAAKESEQEAQRTYHALSADLNATQEQADEARRAGDIAILAETSTRIAALREVMADAAEVMRVKSAARNAAEQDVRAIEQSAASLRKQVDELAAEIGNPRNRWQQAIWRAEGDLQAAQTRVDRAKRDMQDADTRLDELRGRLAAIAG